MGTVLTGTAVFEIVAWTDADEATRRRVLTRNGSRDRLTGASTLATSIQELLEDVRARGDAALVDALSRFDKVDCDMDQLRVSDEEFAAARAILPGQCTRRSSWPSNARPPSTARSSSGRAGRSSPAPQRWARSPARSKARACSSRRARGRSVGAGPDRHTSRRRRGTPGRRRRSAGPDPLRQSRPCHLGGGR